MKYRLTAAFAAALCLIGTVSCGQNGYLSEPDTPETNTASTAKETETTEEESDSTEETAETEPATEVLYYTDSKYNKGELFFSAEVPAEAVVKVDKKTVNIEDNSVTGHFIYYKDKYDRNLIVQSVNDATGETELRSKFIYKYDENGLITYTCCMVRSATTLDTTTVSPVEYRETFFKEQINDPGIYSVINVINGVITDTSDYALDTNGNNKLYSSSEYEMYEPVVDKDGKKYNYDIKNNVIAVYEDETTKEPLETYGYTYDNKGRLVFKYFYDAKGKLNNTYKYTYDEEDRITSKTEIIENYKPDTDSYKQEEQIYEYNTACGKPSKFTLKHYSGEASEDTLIDENTEEYEYDANGNLIKTSFFNSGVQSASVDIYEYEYL